MNAISQHYPHLAARLFNTPLLIHPAKLDAILHGLSGRLGVEYPQPEAYLPHSIKREPDSYHVDQGIAYIDVFGVLAHRSRVNANSSWVQGYDGLENQIQQAAQDSSVLRIVLNLDSPGGEVAGAFQLAEQMVALRKQKPIYALVSDLAASAAYLLASAATSIVLTPTGQVGSIGVVMRHVDVSEAMSKEGIRITHIHAGAHKVDGNPYEPLPNHVRADFQNDVNHYYDLFVQTVAKNRNIDPALIRATEARMFVAKTALELNLIDQISNPQEFISSLITEVNVNQSDLQEQVTSLTALNTDLQTQLLELKSEHEQVTEKLSSEILGLQGQLKAESEQSEKHFTRANQLESQLNQWMADQRETTVRQLFSDLGREYSIESAQPYLSMSAEIFAVVSNDLRSLKPKSFSAELFREVATQPAKESASEASLAAQLFNQVAGVK